MFPTVGWAPVAAVTVFPSLGGKPLPFSRAAYSEARGPGICCSPACPAAEHTSTCRRPWWNVCRRTGVSLYGKRCPPAAGMCLAVGAVCVKEVPVD